MGLTERDAQGYRLRKDGERVSFVYEYATTTFGDWAATGELLAARWKKLGVELSSDGRNWSPSVDTRPTPRLI